MTTLVIVESPTKAKTIRNYLPQGYRVEASMGHVRDLPQSTSEVPDTVKDKRVRELGVKVDSNFEPIYLVPKDKVKVVKALKDALKEADELVLATDEDREGESISWHLLQVLKPKVPTKRMVFHEITESAIQQAIQNCRTVDEQLVRAQETRRILDRLVGYTLSPLLWKKIAYGLSAGRVQSVAVRVLVNRERQRRAFRKGTYWDLKATLETASVENNLASFDARLISIGGVKVASGSDFDEGTGQITPGRRVVLLSETDGFDLQQRLLHEPWRVDDLDERASIRKPSPPFTTSTLQQEANRKMRLSARDTMRTAQSLYEQGYITYMRTDSVHLSEQAIACARSCVSQLYGVDYLSPQPRQYTTKSKNAQEAHEAIRPAGDTFRTPQQTGLSGRELGLYDLIWKRTMATQMADARLTHITVHITVADTVFRATGKRIDFPGFFRAYVEGSDDPDAAIEDQAINLPHLQVGDTPRCKELITIGHETQPPARFTEATLVKTLESEGVGRPSTYASIIGTIIDRGYVKMMNQSLIPTFTAFAVISLLENYFPDLVDLGFTARMEQTLDEISVGEAQWLPYLKDFYLGEQGLDNQVKQRESQIDLIAARTVELDDLAAKVQIGKFGPYVKVDTDKGVVTASIPDTLPPAELNEEQVQNLLRQKTESPDKLGLHPETGEPVYLLTGAYGPYVQLGDLSPENPKPKRASLPKNIDAQSLTLDKGVGLLSLPRFLGLHPDTGGQIHARLGRYGPYLSHALESGDKPEFRSLKGEDDVLSITLERAVQLLADPKWGRGVRGTSTQPLRELGLHPEDGQPVHIYDGRYGPYLKYGKVNASIPDGESVESITLATALNLIAAKATTQKQKRSPQSTPSQSTSKTVQKGERSTQKTTVRQRSSEATKKSRSKSTGNVSKTKKQST